MADQKPRVVIAGVSARAFAESAARAGYWVWAVDAFGDLDLSAFAESIALTGVDRPRFGAVTAARAARPLAARAAAYLSNFENHPAAVRDLARGRALWGNPPQVLARVRNPLLLARVLRRRGFAVPESRGTAPAGGPAAARPRWLLKPRRSGGGHGVVPWRPGDRVPPRCYLQERIAGVPGSITFVADGRRAVPLGITRQLVGDRDFGARGFRYCGSILAGGGDALFGDDSAIRATAIELAQAVTEEFGLVGLNGIDFIARAGVPMPIEVNPRYSASMELVERATGASLFELHARACRDGGLPRGRVPGRRRASLVHGKAIVFARRAVAVGNTRPWLRDGGVADVPRPGQRIARGRPICTVFATGPTAAACHAALRRRAAAIYRRLEPVGTPG